ncbi:tetratricopeptide repeat protein 19, mitochondrial isoform X3 [Sagmatias obliquidens]|uniref:tetratricopeptide repeat protein 19, mitochondrial isoform X3 n=1 Tax=Sagmatias obliquidens TaxID=3371155 RepID=UPI000F4454A6|nr:tetratricopeptide repeat protein 19, mitochondrial isoform X3 [Lagenorhynchus obliquidens]
MAMHRILGAGLALRLLRVAGRRGRGCPARLLPGPAGGRAPAADVPPCREAPRGLGPGLLSLLAALAWSSRPAPAEQERERQGAGGAAAGDAEAEIIQLLKRAKLCIMKDEPAEAELILHDALRLAYKSDNKKAITYTYDLAEKLFKATMSYLLGGGMQQEDNAIIEISVKLATIYAAQNRQELALAGYEFCISTLEEKIGREKELSEDTLSVEEKANTHLLLGMCLETYARYLLFSKQPSQAQRMYEKALQIAEEILGERHPQVRDCKTKLSESRNTKWGQIVSRWPRYIPLLVPDHPSPAPNCLFLEGFEAADEFTGSAQQGLREDWFAQHGILGTESYENLMRNRLTHADPLLSPTHKMPGERRGKRTVGPH